MIRKLLDGIYLLSGILAGCFLVTIFLLMMALSLGREVGINVPAGDDFASWSMAAMAFLGLAHTFKHGEMIRVGIVLDRLKGRARRMVELFCLVVGISFIGYFAASATRLTYDSYRFLDISQGVIAVPLWIPQSGFTLGLWVLLLAMLDETAHVLRGNAPRYEKEPAATPDELVERIASGGGV